MEAIPANAATRIRRRSPAVGALAGIVWQVVTVGCSRTCAGASGNDGTGSTDELLHVQIVDDGRTREACPRGVRVRGEGPGAMGGKEGRQDKDEPTRPHVIRQVDIRL